MTFKIRANLVFAIALAAFAATAWLSVLEDQRLSENNHWVSHTRDVLELSELLPAHVADAATARGTYIRLGDSSQFEKLDTANNLALRDMAELRMWTADNPGQQLRLAQIDPLIRNRLAVLRMSMESHRKNNNDRAAQDAFSTQSATIAAQVVSLIRIFEDVERSLLEVRSAEAETSDARMGKINTLRTIFIFLFLILVFWFLNREFAKQERAERATIEQKRLLQSILDGCSDSVIVADAAGTIILRNPVAAREQGNLHADHLDADYCRRLGLYRSDGETLLETEELVLARALHGESLDSVEICIHPPDGSPTRWKLAAGGPLINAQGHKDGGVVFVRDITDRKEADKQLTNALLEAEVHARENIELSALSDLLLSCNTVREAYKVCESTLPHIFGSCPGALCITSSARDLVEAQAVWGNCSTTELGFRPDDCWGLRRGKPYGERGTETPIRCNHLRCGLTGDYLCLPLSGQGETLGILYLENAGRRSLVSTDAEQIQQSSFRRRAVAVAERVSLALANLRLRELLQHQSIRDPLTGLFNRRYLEESMNRELPRAERSGRPVCVAMLDLDHFKHFNDSFGHQAGDLVLKELGTLIKTRLRAGDLACRFGGEEFALILFEADLDGAIKCVQGICDSIKRISVEYRGQTLGAITVSAGVANFPKHGINLEDLISAADAALYAAKREGRDRVITYSRPDTTSHPTPASVSG